MTSPTSLMSEARALLERYNLSARKGLGQNFLIDRSILDKIVSAADISRSDTIVEVGPGLGVLTRALAERAGKVIAVELDRGMASLLRETMSGLSNVEIVERDILETKVEDLVNGAGYKVVANLPYYITSPVLRHFLESPHQPQSLVVMVQREVARQVVAKPPEMSLLSIAIQFYAVPRIVSHVSAGAFYPPPKVSSAILKIDVLPKRRLQMDDEAVFFKLARAGFSTRRKQLVNAISSGLDLDKARGSELLLKADIDPKRRAETLTIDNWLKLLQSYKERVV
ncbi:16S rRNA (adenine(1518)-N(6)/adenine(1519)-N(6))-dimethyltransferase RsmA [Dehalogenimonas etheniformans]|uniref:Ribosomal RNA small subunit methyltransferase A n=1 Tax=Dehalogenimonas etheniformans TaxID=1536648 RepID=A0A2P5P7C7_9CHLR|nr:16S rRNA (adenine(1518)-N(6)/adenine(1519)-N(6))-dimethyltransferase RsmA [Dehalogenimonas etheniformans]PPD58194.1 ribosomal RNA small subunit methyltransferase A [Dehalogenimonas etheniformans]QNT75603.1 ribosomal RNA small subunit methyltransferase A [Dehalogenimonas etheniformans]